MIQSAASSRDTDLVQVLVVDDQRSARRVIVKILRDFAGVHCVEAESLEQARRALSQQHFDAAIVDMRLQDDLRDRSGLVLVDELRAVGEITTVVVSALGDMADVRAAMRLGAFDFILKDGFAPEQLWPTIERLRDRKRLFNREPSACRSERSNVHELLGDSVAMREVRRRIAKVAPSTRPVLVIGPTGTGKELVARAIHRAGARPEAPIIDVNCGAIPGDLFESELFGHERGAFTGAERRRVGYCEAVGDGTLFLDEIGELPMALQVKLLRVLESGRFRPVGAVRDQAFNARVVAATHRDLAERVREGAFREDLFFRLSVLTVLVPSLEARSEDIPGLVEHFTRLQTRPVRFSEEALRVLMARPWAGNVRELRNVVDRVAVFAEDDDVSAAALRQVLELDASRITADPLRGIARAVLHLQPKNAFSVLERALAAEALHAERGNKSAAARLLGIDRKALERRLSGEADEPSPSSEARVRV